MNKIVSSYDTARFDTMIATPVSVTLSPVQDFDAVERVWRGLESDAEPSFFQSWTWVGCLAEKRFSDPVVLRAERAGRTVGLALLNRTRDRLGTEQLWMNESGDPDWDTVYVEHNGVLLASDALDLLPTCIGAMLKAPIGTAALGPMGRRVRLAGVDAAHLAAAREAGTAHLLHESVAPFIDLDDLPTGSEAYLASLSTNTRYQMRRSERSFAQLGPLVVREADTVAEALEFLDGLAALHQVTWKARGAPGSFANPMFLNFHRALIARALPRGEVALLQIAAGAHVIGYLYNIRLHGRVFTYQSGFDYAASKVLAGPHAKPGLTCHHAAILRARSEGAATYDFLVGPDRYKISLTRSATPLYWIDAAPRYSGQGLTLLLRELASKRERTAGFSDLSQRSSIRVKGPPPGPAAFVWAQRISSGKALVLGDDTRSFLATVRSLGRQGIRVHAAPANFRSSALRSRFIAEIHDLPPWMGDGAEWLTAMEALLRTERFDLVIPCDETALLPLQRYRERLAPLGRLAIPDDQTIAVLFDKYKTRELARKAGVPVAAGRLLRPDDTAEAVLVEFGASVVVKPRYSYSLETLASRGKVQVVHELERLQRLLDGSDPDETVLEQFFAGQGMGVSLLASRGRVLQAFEHHRVREDAGASFYRVSAPLTPDLIRACEAIVAAIQYTGLAMFEFKRNEGGGWILLEINARPWGSMPLPIALGVDFPYRWYRLLTAGEESAAVPYRTGIYGRNLVPDLRALMSEARQLGLAAKTWFIMRRVPELLRPLAAREVHDVLVRDDPLPGLVELAEIPTALRQRGGHLLPGAAARQRWRARRRVRQALRHSAGTSLVLFVCQGNICRSPFAEALARSRLGEGKMMFGSAGMMPQRGRLTPDLGLQAGATYGVDLSTHRSAWLTRWAAEAAALLVVFDETNRAALFDRYPDLSVPVISLGELTGLVSIPDPVDGDLAEFSRIYGQIARGIAELGILSRPDRDRSNTKFPG